ncbi:MAG TPA: glycosyltransferase family 2 protein [Oceanobacillus sp.]|nr:glycosyltransferase family 2 protein [Oceanobacillus sp.]
MNLSIIIPAYERLDDVLKCLNSLYFLRTTDVEFLVQDDCSPSVYFPAVIPPPLAKVERNDTNGGFAVNCNRGAARATGDVLLFCNQDVYGVPEWSSGWDAALLAAFEDSSVGVVAPRLLFPNGAVQSCGGVFDAAYQPVHRCLGYSNPHHPEVATPCEIEWSTGAALAFRRECWEQIGGFDTNYPMYFEDVSACLSACERGWKVWYQPQCTLFHSVGSTGGSPMFPMSARRFKQQWVDSGKVKAGTTLATVRYW